MSNRPACFFPIIISLLLAACTKVPESDDSSAPKVAGDRVTFPAKSPQLTALAVATVETRPSELHRVNGRLAWNEESTVRIYTPVAGRVQSIPVALGDCLNQNAPLARLDSPDFGQAQADAHKASADLQLAERTLARTQDLFEHGAAARKDLDAAENAYAGTQAEKQRTASRLALYGAAADGTVDGLFTLRTPLAGVVVEKNINAGQEVRPDQLLANAPQLFAPLFVLSDPTHLTLLIDATERDLALFRPGLALTVRSSAFPDTKFAGFVERVADSFDPVTRMVTVRGRVENLDRLLKAEMFVSIEFASDSTPGLNIPTQAVFLKGGRHFVFLEEKPGTFVRREVEVGTEQTGKIVVLHGLESNQRIVAEGSLLLDELQSSASGS